MSCRRGVWCLTSRFAFLRACGRRSRGARYRDSRGLLDVALGVVRITPDVSKVHEIRQVTIQPNLAAWLVQFPPSKFPIVPPNARRMIQKVRAKFGLTQDVLRHTFISMHVAKFKSLGDAALQAGNSEVMIRRHYYNVVCEADAAAFWAIAPGAVLGEVVSIAAG